MAQDDGDDDDDFRMNVHMYMFDHSTITADAAVGPMWSVDEVLRAGFNEDTDFYEFAQKMFENPETNCVFSGLYREGDDRNAAEDRARMAVAATARRHKLVFDVN